MSEPLLIADFDGVLNPHGGHATGLLCEPQCVAPFNRVIRETSSKVVICSSWRYLVHHGYMTVNGLNMLLRTHGVNCDVVDVTRPSFDEHDGNEPRWRQIADWLKRNPINGRRYAIVDDDPLAFGGRPGVQTNPTTGLTETDADQLIAILKGN
jgi:hypothetical protein